MSRHHVRELETRLGDADWRVELTRGGHLRWRHRSGAFVFGASTPGDWRAGRNLRAQMRRVERRAARGGMKGGSAF